MVATPISQGEKITILGYFDLKSKLVIGSPFRALDAVLMDLSKTQNKGLRCDPLIESTEFKLLECCHGEWEKVAPTFFP